MLHFIPFEKPHYEQLKSWINTPEILQNWAGGLFSFPLTDRALDWYVEDTNEVPKSDAYNFAVFNDETPIGHISLGSVSYKNSAGRITRVFIDPAARGNGFCKLMVREMLRFGFEELGLHRICLGVYTHNSSAIKCYESAGLKSEGIQRDVLKSGDEYWSLQEMSLLDHEWRNNQVA